MPRLRALLLLIVAVFLLHESLLYLRLIVYDAQFDVLPRVGTTATGDVIRWKKRHLPNPWRTEVQIYDDDGNAYGWQPEAHLKVSAALDAVAVHASLGGMALWRSSFFRRMEFEHGYLFRPRMGLAGMGGNSEQLVEMVNNVERFRRPPVPVGRPTNGKKRKVRRTFGISHFGDCDVMWLLRDGRLVAETQSTGAVLVGVGPDGVRSGPDAADGEPFGELSLLSTGTPARRGLYWLGGRVAFMDSAAGSFFIFSIGDPLPVDVINPGGNTPNVVNLTQAAGPPEPVAVGEPAPIAVQRVDVPASAGSLRGLSGGQWFWGYSGSAGIAVAHGREVLVYGWDGALISRITLDIEVDQLVETQNVTKAGAAGRKGVGFAAVVPPIHPVGMVERHLLMDRDAGTLDTIVVTEPRAGSERAIAASFGLMALTRPAVLNAVAFVGDGPATYDDFFLRGVRDPFFAQGRKAGWLVASLLLATLCGWRTWRHARRQLPGKAATLRWAGAGALLGPVGAVWMRIVVPPLAVLPCSGCGQKCGVGLPACPSCGAAWELPASNEAEVHA